MYLHNYRAHIYLSIVIWQYLYCLYEVDLCDMCMKAVSVALRART